MRRARVQVKPNVAGPGNPNAVKSVSISTDHENEKSNSECSKESLCTKNNHITTVETTLNVLTHDGVGNSDASKTCKVDCVKTANINQNDSLSFLPAPDDDLNQISSVHANNYDENQIVLDKENVPSSDDKNAATDKSVSSAPRRARFVKAIPNIIEASRIRASKQTIIGSEETTSKLTGILGQHRETDNSNTSISPQDRIVAVLPNSAETIVPRVSSIQVYNSDINNSTASVVVAEEKQMSSDNLTIPTASSTQATIVEIVSKKKVRKRRSVVTLTEPVDRTKVTIKDLIYLNPNSTPMKRNNAREAPESTVQREQAIAEAAEKTDDEEEPQPMCPQVMIGPDGQIILNKESLLVRQPAVSKKYDDATPIEFDGDDWDKRFNAIPRKYTKQWSKSETKNFYIALSTVGTDFTMMSRLFAKRSREELKRKFKKEEKVRCHLVDAALASGKEFDLARLDEVFKSDDEKREAEKEEKKKRKLELKEKAERKKSQLPKRPDGRTTGKKQISKKKSRYYDDSSDSDHNPANLQDESCHSYQTSVDDVQMEEVLPDVKKSSTDSTVLSSISKSPADCAVVPVDCKSHVDDGNDNNDNDYIDNDDDDESHTVVSVDDDESDIQAFLRPTRSGRQPKRVAKFDNSYETLLRRGILPPSITNRSDTRSVCDDDVSYVDDDASTVISFADDSISVADERDVMNDNSATVVEEMAAANHDMLVAKAIEDNSFVHQITNQNNFIHQLINQSNIIHQMTDFNSFVPLPTSAHDQENGSIPLLPNQNILMHQLVNQSDSTMDLPVTDNKMSAEESRVDQGDMYKIDSNDRKAEIMQVHKDHLDSVTDAVSNVHEENVNGIASNGLEFQGQNYQQPIVSTLPIVLSSDQLQMLTNQSLSPGQVVLLATPGADGVVHVYIVPPSGPVVGLGDMSASDLSAAPDRFTNR